jgi:hypothetical protein
MGETEREQEPEPRAPIRQRLAGAHRREKVPRMTKRPRSGWGVLAICALIAPVGIPRIAAAMRDQQKVSEASAKQHEEVGKEAATAGEGAPDQVVKPALGAAAVIENGMDACKRQDRKA